MQRNRVRLCVIGAAWVEYVHDELVHKFWHHGDQISTRGVRDRGLLESAVGRPHQTVFGQDLYPTVIGKAAALFHSLVANHPFHDGNKRTAVITVQQFLIANGFMPSLTNENFYELARGTASYRERGIHHDEALLEIHRQLTEGAASFDNVRREIGKIHAVRRRFETISVSKTRTPAARRFLAVVKNGSPAEAKYLAAEANYFAATKDRMRADIQVLEALKKLYVVGKEVRLWIRRSDKNQIIDLS